MNFIIPYELQYVLFYNITFQYFYKNKDNTEFDTMLRAIRTNLFLSETQKILQNSKIDKTHSFISETNLYDILKLMKNGKSKTQLLNCISRNIHSSNLTLRIKSLLVLHACLRQSFDEQFCQLILKQETELVKKYENNKFPELNTYMKQNVINFYIMYLKKLVVHKQSYCFIKQFNLNKQQDSSVIELTSHGFKILNVINYMLQSQDMFNKMGRYHLGYNQIFNMFIQLLRDLGYFNTYIKKSVQYIMRDLNDASRIKLKSNKSLNEINIDLPDQQKKKIKRHTSEVLAENDQYGELQDETQNPQQAQEIKHLYLYIYESQKISDRLYQYYHNRYYYKNLRNIIIFPTFLTLQMKQYKNLKQRAKRADKDMVQCVKKSKYDRQNGIKTQMNNTTLGFTCKTIMHTQIADGNKTISNSSLPYINIMSEFSNNDQPLNKNYQSAFKKRRQVVRIQKVVEDTQDS